MVLSNLFASSRLLSSVLFVTRSKRLCLSASGYYFGASLSPLLLEVTLIGLFDSNVPVALPYLPIPSPCPTTIPPLVLAAVYPVA